MFLLALPCTLGLALLSGPLTISLFQYGNFNGHDALMTQQALVAYCIGLMGLIIIKILAPGFYSRQDIKTPVKIAIATLILTQLMNLAFVGSLKHVGLALSIGLAACFNAGMLFWQIRKQDIYQPLAGWPIFLLKLAIALAVMSAVLVGMLWVMPDWQQGNMLMRILRLLLVVVAGAASYFVTLYAVGFRPKHFSLRAL